MYERRYGLIRTLAPLHVGASAGEEAGNLNLIFRDAYTQTGIIPGSSLRGRFRAEMRRVDDENRSVSKYWYGSEAGADTDDISEARVKFEYASIVWLPVFCPGQPVVWVSCPRLLRRAANSGLCTVSAKQIGALVNTCSQRISGADVRTESEKQVKLFFNLGFLILNRADDEQQNILSSFVPSSFRDEINISQLVVVDDASMGAIHDMALYRQSRVKLKDSEKTVENFFNVEALPEGCMMIFPIAINNHRASDQKQHSQSPFDVQGNTEAWSGVELYFGGLESIGFGRCFTMINEVEK
jgi:CRISPR-associated protein Cmr4